jgi:outer membrane receptor protein involved in Fe transport
MSFAGWAAQLGAVDVLVSQSGLPLENYELMINQSRHQTDVFGFVTVALPEGLHRLHIVDGERVQGVEFQVIPGERTQLLLNIFNEGIVSDLNEPKVPEPVPDLKSNAAGDLSLKVVSVQGEPVAGAKVYARGTQTSGTTNRAGSVKLTLPVGPQVISVTHPQFSTQVVRDVEIAVGGFELKTVELTPAGLVLEDFVVLAPNLKGSIQALIEVRRKAADLSDVMSAEQMSKSGDSDAAGSLKRVTGLTLKDGKYVYVRGLGERYSATLLNGVALPSPDPARRVVPLDLFPVQFLDSMIIQKSYSPNMPGEFGGGVVQLQTKSMPEKFFAKASIGNSVNSNDGNLQGYPSGSLDWLGVDDGGRKLPEGARDNPNLILQNNRHALRDESLRTNEDFSVSVGDRYRLGKIQTGFTASELYKDSINFLEQQRNRYSKPEGVLVQEDDLLRAVTQKERTAGGILGHQVQWTKHHSLNSHLIYLRNTTDYVAVMEGENAEGNTIRQTEYEFAARTLKTLMFQGAHKVPQANDLEMTWHFAQSDARRDEPHRVTARTSPNADGEFVFNIADNTAYQRRYYNLSERADDFGLSLNSPFPWFAKRQGKATLGWTRTRKTRASGMLRFNLEPTGVPCDGDPTTNLDVLIPQCADSIEVRDATQPTDNYLASQQVDAYHFQTQWPLLKSVTFNTGMRFEDSVQKVDTISNLQQDPIFSQLNTQNWLPGSSLTWKINKSMQLRLAQSETISRPDLRELSDTLWQDFETGYDVQGNPTLRATVIQAYDARWEWYFGPRENLSIGVFYKEFENPIETVFTAGSDPRISFFNVDQATLYGAEFEISKNLGFVSSWLRRFTLAGNYAYLDSDVHLGDIQNSENLETNRPLQGQSRYTANFLLDYEHEPWKLNASLAFNVYGRRIAYTAPEGLPNVWEMPVNQLDFVFRKKLGRSTSLRAKVQNILNPEVRWEQEGRVWQALRRGQTYSLSLGVEI